MNLTQFLTILVARRMMIIAAVVASLIGAAIVVAVVPPRYRASSRVMLDVIKPDPVTGQVLANQFLRGFTKTQTELIRDFKVAGLVVDELGWTSDPAMLARYGAPNDPQAARRRLAQIIIDRTDAQLIEGSNILEITYTAWSPDSAKQVADTIRRAYVDATLAFKRDTANQSGDWYQTQAEKARRQLTIAEQQMSQFERQHGIIMQADKSDVDSARLAALSGQADAPAAPSGMAPVAPVSSPSAAQLAQVDAQLAQARQTLGANHPSIRELQQRRAGLAAQAAQERALANSSVAAARSAAGAASVAAGSNRRALEAQKARVLANRENLVKLRQLNDEVDLRRDQYQKAAARVAELRLQGDIADSGLTLLGSAVAPERPAFPNIPLIFGGALGFGLVLGLLAALLTELLSRRVRTSRDLQDVAKDIPVLVVLGSQPSKAAPSPFRLLAKTGRRVEPEPALAA